MNKYDIIIVGGGPAGSAAGYKLAKAGKKTLIIDKAPFPRDKLCGGLITEKTVTALRDVYGDFDLARTVDSEHRTLAYYDRAGLVCKHTHESYKVYLVHRKAFDDYFLEKAKGAGCSVVFGEKVVGAPVPFAEGDSAGGGFVTTASGAEYKGNFIIGADGATSVVRKAVTGKTKKSRHTLTLSTNVPYELVTCFNDAKPVAPDDDAAVPVSPECPPFPTFPRMYFGYVGCGYCWAFPKQEFVTMGICGATVKNEDSLKDLFANFLSDATKGDVRELMAEMKGFPLPCHNYAGPVSKGNVLLTGDAAGLLDPFTGEGIYFAVLSGRLAAEAILSPGDTSEIYKRTVKDSIGRVLGKAYDVRFLFFNPLLRRYSINKLRGNNKYCKYFFELLSEDNDYHNFFMKTLKDRGKYPPE